MKLSFWRKTAAVLMAALLALSTPVLALSETLEAAATAEPTAAPRRNGNSRCDRSAR